MKNNYIDEYISKINSLDKWDKIKIYIHYYTTQLSLKHNCVIVDKQQNKHWGKSDKEFLGIQFHYIWKNTHIKTFEEFFSEKENIVVIDCGDDWEKHGCAQRIRTEYFGVYEWYWKFENI